MNKENVWYKKWWVLVIVIAVLIGGAINTKFMFKNSENTVDNDTQNQEKEKQPATTYSITGEDLGQYGKVITLNKNSDMPAKKYVYKLPAGSYTVTTTFDKMASFYIVKDKISKTGTGAYVEEMNYVGDSYLLTAGGNDFNGSAKTEVTIQLKGDESVQIVGSNTFIFTKQ